MIVLTLSSCSVVKQNGYYQSRRYKTHWVKVKPLKKLKRNDEKVSQRNTYDSQAIAAGIVTDVDVTPKQTEQLINSHEIAISPNAHREILSSKKELLSNDSCDVILLKNGDEIYAIVQEVGLSTIKYKRCNYKDGPNIVIDKQDVFMIRYRNGSKEVIKEAIKEETKPAINSSAPNDDDARTKNAKSPFRTLGWVIWSLGLLIFLFVNYLVGPIILLIGLIIILL